jgi:hypothetical protein
MTEQDKAIVTQESSSDWRPRIYLIGGLIGSILGVLSAYFYVQAADKKHGGDAPEAPGARDTVRLGMSLLSIIRTITEWGSR